MQAPNAERAMGLNLGKLMLLVACVCASPPSSAEALTVSKLEGFCSGLSGSPKTSSQLSCLAYVAGFRSGYDMNAWALPVQVACWPDQADNIQLARVFLKWAAENPARGHEDAALGLLEALTAAFPCPID